MKEQPKPADRRASPPPTVPSRKDLTRERIVGTAARAIRRSGYDGTGVADLMKEAGLTHGGFYAHFASRTALLAEAADRAGADSTARLRAVVEGLPPAQALDALIDHYLSDAHLKSAEHGCPLAALACETPRQAPEVRAAATRRLKETIDLVAQLLPERSAPKARAEAMAVVGSLVGAMSLARAVDDPRLSRSLREACRQSLKHRRG